MSTWPPEGADVQIRHYDGSITVAKVGARVQVSDQHLRQFGINLRPLTPEEEADQDRKAAELDAQRAVVAARIPGELARLDAITDPVSRLVLDLHRRTPSYSDWACATCFDGGDMGDHIEWPCDTTLAIAAHHGIDLDDMWLFTRPVDGSLDAPTTEDQ